MNDLNKILPLTTVEDVQASLRELVRLARQREVWTQADLARRSGVPREFAVKEAFRECRYLVCSLCRTFGAIGNI